MNRMWWPTTRLLVWGCRWNDGAIYEMRAEKRINSALPPVFPILINGTTIQSEDSFIQGSATFKQSPGPLMPPLQSFLNLFPLSIPTDLCVCVCFSHLVMTLCDPMDCSLPGSSVHGILQARILEWVAIPFSRGSSGPRDWTWVSCIAGRFFTIWAMREALYY